MKFVVKCPHCSEPFTVEENWAGQLTNCPICGHQVRVPQPPPSANGPSQRPFTAVPRASEGDEHHGPSFAGEAFMDFLLSLICCWILGLILALRTHGKMRENNNFAGVWWLYLAYAAIVLQLFGGVIYQLLMHSGVFPQ